MTHFVRYGTNSVIKIDLDNGALVADCAGSGGEPVDPAVAIERAIRQPIEFPPLSNAVTPGDRVVLALGRDVPRGAELIAPIVRTLIDNGVLPEDIAILRTREDVAAGLEPPGSRLPAAERAVVRSVVHDPDLRSELAYLASTAEGHTVYLNRALCDADLVVPLARSCCRRSGDGLGSLDPLFPTFSDTATHERYARLALAGGSATARADAREEMREVSWLLGVMFSVVVVPAGNGCVLDVLAGHPDAARKLARKRCEETWNCAVPRRASLVIAAIEGDASQQTWESVGRAAAAAARAVTDNGAIALCTRLGAQPGPAVRQLAEAEDLRHALRRIRKQRCDDALPAVQLARAMDRARVYLLSELDDDVVEELGLAPVPSAEDISRLAARHESCILLGNAQYSVPTPLVDD